MTRTVKLGRKPMTPIISGPTHWAVKVDNTWYEISPRGSGEKKSGKGNWIQRSYGYRAASKAGSFGGELAGETDKTDGEIDEWIDDWQDQYPSYEMLEKNCQKFAYEFINWLTDGNFICGHRFDSADVDIEMEAKDIKFASAKNGNAVARYASHTQGRTSSGPFSESHRGLNLQAQAVAGPGLGAWADASVYRVEGSVGNIVGAHIDPNVNTGVGIRNGNVDCHLLGFGFKAGSDGLEVNTPLGGVNACNVM